MDADTARIRAYLRASASFAKTWSDVEARCEGMALRSAHEIVVAFAERWLPTTNPATSS